MKKLALIIPFLIIFFHLMYADDGPNMWSLSTATTSGVWQDGIVINPTNQDIMYAGTAGAGVYKTTNAGLNWVQVNSGLTNLIVQSMAISKSNPNVIMCGTTNTGTSPGVYRSTDAGATWTLKNNGITESGILPQAIAIDPTNPDVAFTVIFNGTTDAVNGVFKTTNGGDNWFTATTGLGTLKNFLCIAINPLNHNVIYIGSSYSITGGANGGPQKIYKSVNGGSTWMDASNGLPSLITDINPVRSMSISTVDTGIVLTGLFQNTTTNGGVFLSTNGGGSWTKIQTGLPNISGALVRSALIRPGSNTEFYLGYDGSTSTGVWRTTNQGQSWTNFSGGALLATYIVRALAFRTAADSTVYAGVAGTTGFGVYEYTYIPVGVSGKNGKIPKDFALYPNYPNPFNPVTNIQYDIPKVSDVSLKVYDISGREAAALVNENKLPGSYNVTFDASNLSSGVYFYKLSAGDYTKTMKMILVK
jgi:photosystem II stability/assembly factor-like uncharacterized protein